ncbi:hypothetical protein CEY16_10340 [Halalkalibacillus sediminis]|uniref:Uncharacterized protein n=1 Tax=Halalkalibacillus sediminis TaxID=2018042 RepID=A0A2I0QS10_9BACI|nr:hypothetical protein [Halalkalibacillus sediminis]PKR77135.1 hypothetical protein CEY16_10340 [Halalkalibacillus sediminis]
MKKHVWPVILTLCIILMAVLFIVQIPEIKSEQPNLTFGAKQHAEVDAGEKRKGEVSVNGETGSNDSSTYFEQVADQPKEEKMDFIKQHVQLNWTKQNVVEFFRGYKYVEVRGAMENRQIYQYDFGKEEGYEFVPELDEVDLQGIADGKLELSVGVAFSNEVDEIDFLVINYLNDTTGNPESFYRMAVAGGEVYEKVDIHETIY